MLITEIALNNMLCHRSLRLPIGDGTTLIAGRNGAGKSALLDAIKLALIGDMPRGVSLKKELPNLITHGADAGSCSVTTSTNGASTTTKLNLKTGAHSPAAPLAGNVSAFLPLSPADFHASQAADRRRALLHAYNIPINKAAILQKLADAGHDPARIARIEPTLSGGFDAASKRAKELVSEARGAWASITGEAYGSTKAQGWKATPVGLDTELEPASTYSEMLAAARADLTKATSARDILISQRNDARRATELRAEAAKLPEAMAAVDAMVADIAAAEAEAARLSKLAAEAAEAAAAARASTAGWLADCPCCGESLRSPSPGKLVPAGHLPAADAAPSPGLAAADAQAAELKLSQLRQRLGVAQRAQDQARAAQLAAGQIPEPPTDAEIESANSAVSLAMNSVRAMESLLDRARISESATADAAIATSRAEAEHNNLVAYAAMADDLAAMPAAFLRSAMDQVNASLAAASSAIGFPVTLGEDMTVRHGSVPYPLLSESQQWRADLALGIALGRATGTPVLMDRFDMVQPSDRGQVLHALAALTDVQVIITATLKAPPAFPEGTRITPVWLEGAQ